MMQSLDIYNNAQLCLALSLSDLYTVEPPNYSEVVFSSEVLTCIQLLAGDTQFVHCREVVCSSECPLLEVPLYTSADGK